MQLTRWPVAALIASLAAGTLSGAIVRAQESRTVHARLTFKAESRALRTSACLQLTERMFPATPWWEASPATTGPEAAFKAVIAAIKKKDRAALLALTDASQKRDMKKFDAQAAAFFQQFDTIRLVEVTRAYEFDDLAVFFGKFQSGTQSAYVPLTFAAQRDNSFAFLPERSNKPTFDLVTDWFGEGPGERDDQRLYCSEADVARATHRVPLQRASFRPSALLLAGGPVSAPGPAAAVAKPVLARIEQMKAAIKKDDIAAFAQFMTVEGGGRLRQWWASATKEDRDRYRDAFLQQQPIFVFDASPLVVVYIRINVPDAAKPTGVAPGVQLLYFTPAAAGEWLWTNSSHITTADKVFKDTAMGTAAAAAEPFSSLVVK